MKLEEIVNGRHTEFIFESRVYVRNYGISYINIKKSEILATNNIENHCIPNEANTKEETDEEFEGSLAPITKNAFQDIEDIKQLTNKALK